MLYVARQRSPVPQEVLVSTGFPFPLCKKVLGTCPYRCPFEARMKSPLGSTTNWVDLCGNGLHLMVAGAVMAWAFLAINPRAMPAEISLIALDAGDSDQDFLTE